MQEKATAQEKVAREKAAAEQERQRKAGEAQRELEREQAARVAAERKAAEEARAEAERKAVVMEKQLADATATKDADEARAKTERKTAEQLADVHASTIGVDTETPSHIPAASLAVDLDPAKLTVKLDAQLGESGGSADVFRGTFGFTRGQPPDAVAVKVFRSTKGVNGDEPGTGDDFGFGGDFSDALDDAEAANDSLATGEQEALNASFANLPEDETGIKHDVEPEEVYDEGDEGDEEDAGPSKRPAIKITGEKTGCQFDPEQRFPPVQRL